MNKQALLKDLTKLANKLDEQGKYKIANAIDRIIKKATPKHDFRYDTDPKVFTPPPEDRDEWSYDDEMTYGDSGEGFSREFVEQRTKQDEAKRLTNNKSAVEKFVKALTEEDFKFLSGLVMERFMEGKNKEASKSIDRIVKK